MLVKPGRLDRKIVRPLAVPLEEERYNSSPMRPVPTSEPIPPTDGDMIGELPAGDLVWQAPISDDEFDYFRDIAYREAGISIADYKRNMVFRRVSKRVRALGLASVSDYRAFLDGPRRDLEMQNLVNVLTTNKTSFFREGHHFHFLRETVLPDLQEHRKPGTRRLRIWSAGCSSGEEAYSIAMVLNESIREITNWDARILATDIDTEMVDHGRRGIYPAEFIGDIPAEFRERYTVRAGVGAFKMARELQNLIAFRHLNVLGPWPMGGPFDMIFCRNVVIYFDKQTKQELFDRFAEILSPDGLLFIGHSESLFKVSKRFKMVGQSVYQRME